jgi:hypothetical protein
MHLMYSYRLVKLENTFFPHKQIKRQKVRRMRLKTLRVPQTKRKINFLITYSSTKETRMGMHVVFRIISFRTYV